MKAWLDSLGYADYTLTAASADASFRSYHRLSCDERSWIVMDAPPQHEPCDQFIAVAEKLRSAGLSAPRVIEQNLEQGFLLLTDFGDSDYLSVLDEHTEAALYTDALNAVLMMQTKIDCTGLPPYDTALLNTEMDLFHDWFLGELLNIELNQTQSERWVSIKQLLVENALAQPQVFVHRDFHSRNLMKLDAGNPGILDFQDAVKGPISYDLVSLLRDCYICWPVEQVLNRLRRYHRLAVENALTDADYDQFLRWFNLMGVQRHLKAIGIFSRLKLRDGKPGFIRDIPRTLHYIQQLNSDDSPVTELHSLINELDIHVRLKPML